MLLGLEFCAWYILLVCPNHPRINLSFLGHCLSYDENLDGLSTLYPTYSTPWTFSAAESHKLNRKLHIKLIRKDKKWKHYGTGRFDSESSQNPFFGTWKFYPKSFFWDRNWTFSMVCNLKLVKERLTKQFSCEIQFKLQINWLDDIK